MFKVEIIQNDNMVMMGFNKMSDASNFVDICLECGEDGTKITIYEEKED